LITLDELTEDTEATEAIKSLRRAYSCFPSGVTALCGLLDGAPVGMVASSFTSVSLTPALVSVCIQDTSRTWPRLRRCPMLGVSVLAAAHDAVCQSLSRREGDRFADVQWDFADDGAVFLHGATAWMGCSVQAELPAGDHSIVLMRIHGLRAQPEATPLIFHGSRFRTLAALE
jgi:flavin reductase (DIM6/NTAB) family NADH-FMN oxidoreductase RutF